MGNVPFGNYQVFDPEYNHLGFSIHNYFAAKMLDQVRPGGIMAFVTSRYTMDARDESVRRYLAERGELLGAIRLPNNAFRANAGTEVVSDITGEYIQMVVDKVFCCGVANRSHFNIVARDGKTYYFSLKPYRVTGADRYSTVYIVYISREGYVGGAEREGLKSDSRLTNRQIEIVNLIAAGLTNSEIASHLHISEHTVRKHIENIRVQLGVGNRIAILNELDLL